MKFLRIYQEIFVTFFYHIFYELKDGTKDLYIFKLFILIENHLYFITLLFILLQFKNNSNRFKYFYIYYYKRLKKHPSDIKLKTINKNQLIYIQ